MTGIWFLLLMIAALSAGLFEEAMARETSGK